MVSFNDIKSQLANEINVINSVTGENNTTLHSAIVSLISNLKSEEILPEVIEFDSTNVKLKAFVDEAERVYPTTSGTIVDQYANPSEEPGYDKPNGYTIQDITDGKIIIIDEQTGAGYTKEFIGNSIIVYNLHPHHIYKIFVMDGDNLQKSLRIKDTCKYRQLRMEGEASNVRDIGGLITTDGGKIKYGYVYRGQRLDGSTAPRITDNDKKVLWNQEHIGYQIDMRTEGAGIGNIISVISPYTIFDHHPIGGGYDYYFATTSGTKENAKEIIEETLTKLSMGLPVFINCQDGADRTGTLVSIILGICDVPTWQIEIDYEISSFLLFRKRTRNEWETWINHINSKSGKNKWISYCLEMGIDVELINAVRNILKEGGVNEPYVPEFDVEKINILNEIGYEDNKRLNSSGSTSSASGYRVTGLIPVVKGDTIQFENFKIASTSNVGEPYYKNGYTKVYVYDANQSIIFNDNVNNINRSPNNCEIDDGGFITKLTLNQIGTNDLSSMAYIRLSAYMEDNPAIYKL